MFYSFIYSILYQKTFVGEDFEVTDFFLDSRYITSEKSCFIALKGKNTDGHLFIEEAIKKGSNVILYQNFYEEQIKALKQKYINVYFCPVPFAEIALMELACRWRLLFKGKIVGITGSMGKTTTKDLFLCGVSALNLNYVGTVGNLNSVYGVALSLLRSPLDIDLGFFEAGISEIGEMEKISYMLRPDIVVLTSISDVHLGALKNKETILNEKLKLLMYKKDNVKVELVINDQCPFLSAHFNKNLVKNYAVQNIFFVGSSGSCVFLMDKKNIDEGCKYRLEYCGVDFNGSFYIDHNGLLQLIPLVVFVLGQFTNKISDIINQIGLYKPLFNRFQVIKKENSIFVLDAYNANLESMICGIDVFLKMTVVKNKKKILILGSMLDLGDLSDQIHKSLGEFLFSIADSVDKIVLLGKEMQLLKKIILKENVIFVKSLEEIVDLIYNFEKESKENSFFVKASYGVGLYNLIEKI
jgi:UDP-N-acetylmuramoyl-tripeptide--D-alanyl-D-alanine ligase